jgi:hypothetical protein
VPSLRSATACFIPAEIWMTSRRPVTPTGVTDGFRYLPDSQLAPSARCPAGLRRSSPRTQPSRPRGGRTAWTRRARPATPFRGGLIASGVVNTRFGDAGFAGCPCASRPHPITEPSAFTTRSSRASPRGGWQVLEATSERQRRAVATVPRRIALVVWGAYDAALAESSTRRGILSSRRRRHLLTPSA